MNEVICGACGVKNPTHAMYCGKCGEALFKQPQRNRSAGAQNDKNVAAASVTDADADIVQLAAAGNKIEAVKLYRQRHGVGLAEAKQTVESWRDATPVDSESPDNEEVLKLLASGQKIAAIRVYRQHHHCGLADAKAAVEALADKHQLSVPSGSGCSVSSASALVFVAAGYFVWQAVWS